MGMLRPGSAEEAGMIPERVAYARDLCAGWVRQGHTPTLSVCVARRGVIVLNEAFGVLGPGPDSPPLTRDALFPVTSITKSVTATLVMQLVEDGVLGLVRPVVDYLPELTGVGVEDMLVHHLLTHTSGLPDNTDALVLEHTTRKRQGGFVPAPCPPNQHPEIQDWLSLLWDMPRATVAGEVMIYSNFNYVLLGEIVRRISGRSLEEQARRRLFAPLGMNASYYEVPQSQSHRVVQRAPGLPHADPLDPRLNIGSRLRQEVPSAAGGLFSTPLDLAIFGQTLLDRGRYGTARILSPAAVAAMSCNQVPGLKARFLGKAFDIASCGYGLLVASTRKWKYWDSSLRPIGTFGHSGAGGSCFWVDREHELVGVYFEVATRMTKDFEIMWNLDLFQNVITAAMAD